MKRLTSDAERDRNSRMTIQSIAHDELSVIRRIIRDRASAATWRALLAGMSAQKAILCSAAVCDWCVSEMACELLMSLM
jgi:predicted secreted protein